MVSTPLVVQDNAEKGLVDLDFAIVFDETELSELVHEHIHSRASRTDHLRQGFLGHLLKYPLGLTFLIITREQQQSTRQPLLSGVEELVNQIRLNPDVPCKHVGDEAVGP